MKIGPLEIRMAVRKAAPTDELGQTGTAIFGEQLGQTDYNAALQAPDSYAVYDQMRKGDGMIAAILRVLKLPLVNATWSIERVSDKPLDRMIAEVIEEDLFKNMTISFTAWLRQALLHLDWGVMVFEECWRIGDDGLVRLQKLAPRIPASITQWNMDANGGLRGIQQQAPPNFTPIDIPIDKLLVFTNDLEGSDYRGTSVLRAAVKHWRYVDGLERVAAIAIEKRAMGMDVGTLKGEARTEEHKRDAEHALMGIRAHEKNYVVEVDEQFGYRLETGGTGGLLDPLPMIQHHNLQALRSCLVEFVGMGAGSTGSLAMSRDKTSWVLLCLGGIADFICDTTTRHLFKRWVDYNWAGAEAPRLRCSRLEQRDVAVFADAIEKLTASGALTADETVESESRELLSLPERVGPRAAPAMPEEEMPGIEEMPTGEMVATIRALRRTLKRRREAESEPEMAGNGVENA